MTEKQAHTEPADRLAATLALDEPVGHVRLVSPARAKALAGLGISSVRDLLTHYPRRYVDLSAKKSIAQARIGERCTIEGSVHEVKLKRPKPRLTLTEVTLVDDTGTLIVTCFRQPWLAEQLSPGMRVAVAGAVEFNFGFKRMTNPYLEKLEGGQGAEGMIIPVHPACEKVSAAWMRRLVGNALQLCMGMLDPLPLDVRLRHRLMSRGQALRCIHFPQTMEEAAQGRRRLSYEELLMLQLKLIGDGRAREEGCAAMSHTVDGPCVSALAEALPFALTEDQSAARDAILGDMASPHAMNRMLLGDVGTGKTAVAAFALAAVADTGTQALMMAPTEVLARQHGESLGPWLDAAGVSWRVLTGSTPAAERAEVLELLASGSLPVLIGTHALLEDDVAPARCSLVVIDEQQRFGVEQREKLLAKGTAVDALSLTATPIPRSLALALFGAMELTYLRQRPSTAAGRTTKVLSKRDKGHAYDAAREALERGEQVYVVCPLVGQSTQERDERAGKRASREGDEDEYVYAAISIEDDGDYAGEDVAAAQPEAEFLQRSVFADWSVELLCGRMSGAQKQQTMERFRSGEVQVLVATTVIEVGVDVLNATVMIIEDADRFGLSQLHQLRGRVGRGSKKGQVFLVSASRTDAALARLSAMEGTDDGLELAAFDLSLRREGDILGNRQSGASTLKLVNVVRDADIIEAAHADALAILDADPQLSAQDHRALAREVRIAAARGEERQRGRKG